MEIKTTKVVFLFKKLIHIFEKSQVIVFITCV